MKKSTIIRIYLIAIGIFSTTAISKNFDSETSSKIFLLLNYSSIIICIACLGMNQQIIIETANNKFGKRKLIQILTISVFTTTLLSILINPLFLKGLLDKKIDLLLYTALNSCIAMQIILGDTFRGISNYNKYQLISNGTPAISITATGAIGLTVINATIYIFYLFKIPISINLLLKTSLLTSLSIIILSTIFLCKNENLINHKGNIDKDFLKKSANQFFLIAGFILYASLDLIFLKYIKSQAEEINSYSVALRLVMFIHIAQAFFSNYYQSSLANLYINNKAKEIKTTCKKITKNSLYFGLFIYLFFLIFGLLVISYFFNVNSADAYLIFIIKGISFIILLASGAVVPLMTVTGHAKFAVKNIGLSILIEFILFFIFLFAIYNPNQKYNYIYIASITSVSHIFYIYLCWKDGKKIYGIAFDYFSLRNHNS